MIDQKYTKLMENGSVADTSMGKSKPTMASDTARKLVVLTAIVLLISGSALGLYKGSKWFNRKDFIKFEYPLEGSSGLMQQVYSSVEDNYVQYYIERSPSEKTWILDDFNTDLQTIRSDEGGRSVCFVAQLEREEAMAPTAELPPFVPYKERTHEVYSSEERPVNDRSFLGPIAEALCDNASVYWVHQVAEFTTNRSDSDSTHSNMAPADAMSEDIMTSQENMTSSDVARPDERAKRGISHCRTSCCWLVCCCNSRQFTWEGSEHATCRHICDKCSKAYKAVIRRIC